MFRFTVEYGYCGEVEASNFVEICFVVIGFIRGLDCQCLLKFSLGKAKFVKIN